jgi:ABC-type metal ion transport system substrate-binding protein
MTTTPTLPQQPDQHGFELKRRRTWIWVAVAVVVLIVAAVVVRYTLFSGKKSANEVAGATLVVATQEGYVGEQKLIEFVGREVAPKYGIKVAFRGLADSNTINRAISDGEIAGTTYQHKLWLDQVLEANPDFKETATEPPIFRWAFGIWSAKYKHPQDIPDGSTIGLNADPANNSQGLWFLQKAGLLTLRPDAGSTTLTERDIVANPRNLKFTLLDFAAQPRALQDIAAAAGYNSDFVLGGTPAEDLIFQVPPPDEFAAVLTIGSKWADTDNIKKLVQAFHDPAVQHFLATDPDVRGSLLPFQNG